MHSRPVVFLSCGFFSPSLSVFSCVLFVSSSESFRPLVVVVIYSVQRHMSCHVRNPSVVLLLFFFTLAKTRRSPNRSKLLRQPSAISYLTIMHGMLQWSSMHQKHLSLKLVLQCKIYIYLFLWVWFLCWNGQSVRQMQKWRGKQRQLHFLSFFPILFFFSLCDSIRFSRNSATNKALSHG